MEFKRAVEESAREAGYGSLKVKQLEHLYLAKIHLWLFQLDMANPLYMLLYQVYLTN